MVRQPIRISLPLFRTRASSKNFHKIVKSSNRPLEMGRHLNYYLPTRYVANGEDVTRNSHGKKHIDFTITTFRFCNQPQNSVLHPLKQIEFLGLVIDAEKDFGSFREKIALTCMCFNDVIRFSRNQNFSLKSHKVNWPVVINCPGHFTSTNSVLISSTGANISPTVIMWHWTI